MPALDDLTAGFERLRRYRTAAHASVAEIAGRVAALNENMRRWLGDQEVGGALGLDSFRFQARIVHMEHASLLATLEAIDRNMYYECYRLHKDIQAYVKAEVASPVIRGRIAAARSYPSYSHPQTDLPALSILPLSCMRTSCRRLGRWESTTSK